MFAKFLIIACLSVCGLATTLNDCPSGLKRDKYLKAHGNYCYRFVLNERKSFQDAEDVCQNDGGNLATVNSESFNEYLKDTLKDSYFLYYTPVWIGLHSKSRVFSWVDGTKVQYNDLHLSSSDTLSDECVALNPGEDNWLTYRCDGWVFFEQTNRYICEYHVTKTTSSQSNNDGCPVKSDKDDEIQSLGNTCYYFGVTELLTFQKAEGFCEKYGGRLAQVKSQKINDFLFHHISDTHKLSKESESPWIGLRYTGSPSVLHWVDGTGVQYSNFYLRASSYNGDCVAMTPADGRWKTHYCTDYSIDARHFICEFDKKTSALVTPTVPTKPKTTAKPVVKTTQGRTLPKIPTNKPPTVDKNHRCPVGSGDDVKVLDNKCYYFSMEQKLSFQQAESFCEKNGGMLALVKNQKINEFIHHHLLFTHKQGYGSEPVWIGLQYSQSYYAYRWIDHSSSSKYKNFEPGSKQGNCVAMSGVDGEWTKQYCTDGYSAAKHFICEYDET